jgi:type VI secretion system ImpC/EvpB family protein/type VI secretion system ImpB/VipA family protein
MPGRLEFNLSLSRQDGPRISSITEQSPMRLLVMGDFSGQPAAVRKPLAERPTWRVEVDNLDTVMRRMLPQLKLPAGEVEFAGLDDFHPDSLYARLDVFRALREMRQRLSDPAGFAQAAAELRQGTDAPVAPPAAALAVTAAPVGGSGGSGGSDGSLLAQLLGGNPVAVAAPVGAPVAALVAAPAATPATTTATATAAQGIDAFIRSIVAPYIVPDIAPQQASLIASVDAAITDQMRRVLHAPAFQQLESAWRGVQWLISSLELGEQLQLHLFDVGRDELLADVLAAQGRIDQTGSYRALVDRWRNQPGGQGWSALAALFSFGPSVDDIGLLAALGVLASQAGGPVLAAGDLSLAGADAPALAGWHTLRRSEVAPWIGLAAPRVLLRLPYGQGRDPVAGFAFEEVGHAHQHTQLLWASGALASLLLIGRAFSARGWAFEPGDEREIGDLPAFTCINDGEPEMQACAEQYLGEAASELLMSAGLMPVMSHRHRNAVTVVRFQSVALPSQALRGWTHG